MDKTASDTSQWDRYWDYGNIHSFSQNAAGNYDGVVADFWRARFEGLEDGARLLDVGTGNGAIALLALESADRLTRRVELHGVDMADIEPAKQVRDRALAQALERIRFHGSTGAEAMPFADGFFDLACSQFGIEYSDLSRSIPEVGRVLRPGGGFSAILHHRHSVLLQATREELAQLEFVLDEVKLYLRARNLLRTLRDEKRRAGGGSRPGPELEKKHKALKQAMDRVRDAAESSRNPNMLLGPMRYVQEIFAALPRSTPDEMLGWLDEAWRRVEANRRRLLDMLEAARGEAEMEDLRSRLEACGFTGIDMDVFRQEDGELLGWRLDAGKGAGE